MEHAKHPTPRWPLYLALALYFLLTACLIARVPLEKAPDEAAHWQYIEHIATTGTLPIFKGQVPPAPGYEFHQPPLYYAISAIFWAILPAGVENYSARFVSLLCGLGTVALVWGAARLVFPKRSEIAHLSALLVALWPLHEGVGAVSGNDALAGLICAALFYVSARVLCEGTTRRETWQIGVLVGLGLLTKTTIVVVSLAALGALYAGARTNNGEEATAEAASPLRPTLTALLIGLVVSAPMLLRNQLLYGDPLALKAFSGAAASASPGYAIFSQVGISLFTYARGMLWMILITAWGFYGGSDTASHRTSPLSPDGPRLPDVFLLPLLALCVLAPLVALLGWKRLDDETRTEWGRVALFWGAGVALVVLAWAKFAYDYFAGGQARYLHPALLPVAIFLVAGWVGVWGRGRALWVASAAFGAVLIGLTLLNLFVWRTLA